jgi:hypothetical protein
MLRGLFRRSSTANTPPKLDPFDKSLRFTLDHPFLTSNFSEVSLDTLAESSSFSRLIAWLNKYPEAKALLSLRLSHAPLDDVHQEFCDYALKSQIHDGFAFMDRCSQVHDQVPGRSALMSVHPWVEGARLYSVKKLWRYVHARDDIAAGLRKELLQGVHRNMAKARTTISMVVSLLASSGAIPPEYLLIADFTYFDLSFEGIVAKDATLGRIQAAIKLLTQTSVKIECICDTGNRYVKYKHVDVFEQQISALRQVLDSYRPEYDRQLHSIRASGDSHEFLDFVHHPGSLGYPLMEAFEQDKSPVQFTEFVLAFLSEFRIADADDTQLLSAVITHSVGPQLLPDVKADGTGTLDTELLNFALELFACDDPLRLLGLIGRKIEGNDAVGAVRLASNALKTLTSSWKEVLRFGVDVAAGRFLPHQWRPLSDAIQELLEDNEL